MSIPNILMTGVDVASYQGAFDINNDSVAGKKVDFVIAKATEGTGYVNPYCDSVIQAAIRGGKPFGYYHYATGAGVQAEGDFHISQTSGYVKKGINVIDWEAQENSAWGNGQYLKQLADYLHSKTGVWPIIYTNSEGLQQAAQTDVLNNCGVWFAGYPYNNGSWDVPPFIYDIPQLTMVMWQFDSAGGYDKNFSFINSAAWAKYAGGSESHSTPTPAPAPAQPSYSASGKSLESLADDVVAGRAPNGDERKASFGNYYNAVQAIVNQRFGAASEASTISTLASEVNSGRLGNGDDRKFLLGSYYDRVQAKINGTSDAQYYTVQSGDTLSGIGAEFDTPYLMIAAWNNITVPYTIYPGQTIRVK